MYVCMYVCICVCVRACVCVCIYTYIYIYKIYIYFKLYVYSALLVEIKTMYIHKNNILNTFFSNELLIFFSVLQIKGVFCVL
jgi:hypothetical protein